MKSEKNILASLEIEFEEYRDIELDDIQKSDLISMCDSLIKQNKNLIAKVSIFKQRMKTIVDEIGDL